MSEEIGLINLLVETAVNEVDRQYMENGLDYFDPARGFIEGEVDFEELIREVVRALREEEGE